MPIVIKEYIYDLVRSIGNAYTLINSGIGDTNTPGTALFELEQINSLATNGLPYFGILDVPNGFLVTPTQANPNGMSPTTTDLMSRQVLVNRGQVGFKGQIVNIPTQTVPIATSFAMTYTENSVDPNYYYGVLLGLKYSELTKASTVLNTVTTNVATTNQTYITVQDIKSVFNLGFPIKAVVNNTVIEFSDGDLNTGVLYVSPSSPSIGIGNSSISYGIVGSSFPAQTRVTFIYQPKINTFFNAPVLCYPDVSTYFPYIPNDVLPIAKLLVSNPNSPTLVTSNNYQIQDIQNLYSLTTGLSTTEQTGLINDYNTLKKSIGTSLNYTSAANLIQSLVQYTNAIDGGGQSFVQYWAGQPFEAVNSYAPGISFNNLQRFEFPTSFSKAYFSLNKQQDTMHTLGIFRGDLISKQQANSAATPPVSSAVTVTTIDLPNGSLTTGTIIYNITGVDINGLESAPTPLVVTASNGNSIYIANQLNWTTNANTTYNIYRNSNVIGNIESLCLSPIGGFKYISPPIPDSCTPNGYYIINNNFLLIHVTSTGCLLGGVNIPLIPVSNGTLATLLTLLDGIQAFYWGTSTSGTSVPTSQYGSSSFAFANFSTNSTLTTNCFITFNNFIQLPAGDHYIALYFPTDALGLLQIAMQSTGSNSTYTTNSTSYGTSDYTNPLTVTGFSEISGTLPITVYGFLDYGQPGTQMSSNGVYITGEVTNKPSRLVANVPLLTLTNDLLGTPVVTNSSATPPAATALTNDILLTVYARNTITGATNTLTTTLTQGTLRGTKTLLGATTDLFDTIDYMYVQVGNNFNVTSDNRVLWTISDLVTVENAI